MTGNNKKLLVYSQDGLGLGHQRRTSRIVNELLRMAPYFSVLTLCDSPLGQFFLGPPNHRYIKIPTIVKTGDGVWKTTDKYSLDKVIGTRQKRMMDALETFAPDVFLIDHMPQGAFGELLPIVEKAKKIGCKLVLGLRDILDKPEIIIDRWQREGAYSILEEFYDHVLIYGQCEIFDTKGIYRIPSTIPHTYCGYVGPSRHNGVNADIQETIVDNEDPECKQILVSFGGGADGRGLAEKIMLALLEVSQHLAITSLIIAGPFNSLINRNSTGNGPPNIKTISKTDNMLKYMLEADGIISMAGYNTISEILFSRTNALVIPRQGPSREQQMRVNIFQKMGLLDFTSPHEINSIHLSEKIGSLLKQSAPKLTCSIDLMGAENAASILVDL